MKETPDLMVFVAGSVCSGTSTVQSALNRAFERTARPEDELGRLFGAADGVVAGLLESPSPEGDGADGNAREARLKSLLRQGAEDAIAAAIASDPTRSWVGYMPDVVGRPSGALATAPLAEHYPDARFIFCRADGRANVRARMRRYPDRSFLRHCVGWAMIMETWRELRDQLNGRALEIDRREIGSAPAEVAGRLADFLALDEPRKRGLLGAVMDLALTQQFDDERTKTVQDSWSLDEHIVFTAACATPVQAFGYELKPPFFGATPVLALDLEGIEIERQGADFAPWALIGFPGGFQLHPAQPGEPAPTLVFRDVPAWGESVLKGHLLNVHPDAPTVEFDLKLTLSRSKRVVYARRHTLGPVTTLPLEESFHSGRDNVDVEVSVRTVSSRSNRNAWARVAGLRVLPAKAPE